MPRSFRKTQARAAKQAYQAKESVAVLDRPRERLIEVQNPRSSRQADGRLETHYEDPRAVEVLPNTDQAYRQADGKLVAARADGTIVEVGPNTGPMYTPDGRLVDAQFPRAYPEGAFRHTDGRIVVRQTDGSLVEVAPNTGSAYPQGAFRQADGRLVVRQADGSLVEVDQNSETFRQADGQLVARQADGSLVAVSPAPNDYSGVEDEVEDLQYGLMHTKSPAEVREIAAEMATRVNSTISPKDLKAASEGLINNASDRMAVLKIADDLRGRTDAVIHLDVIKDLGDRFAAAAENHRAVVMTANDISCNLHPVHGDEETYWCDRFRNTTNGSAVMALVDEINALDRPKRLAERFRAVANSKVQIKELSDTIHAECVPPPDGHPNADLTHICDRMVAAKTEADVIAIADEVAARTA